MNKEFISQSIMRLKESEERIIKCINELTLEEIWQKPNSNLNSVGNLVHHVCGNMTQYIFSSIGGNADERNRDLEFHTNNGSKTELNQLISNSFNQVMDVLNVISGEELNREREVQGFMLTGTGIIIHVVEHLSYHTGQITFWTKYLKDKDLGYYSELNLNVKNK